MAKTEAKYQADNERFDWLYENLTDEQVVEYHRDIVPLIPLSIKRVGRVMDWLRLMAANDHAYWDDHFKGIADDDKVKHAEDKAVMG